MLFDEVSEEKEKLWFGLNLRRALRIGQALSLMQIALASLHTLHLQRSCIVLLRMNGGCRSNNLYVRLQTHICYLLRSDIHIRRGRSHAGGHQQLAMVMQVTLNAMYSKISTSVSTTHS